MDSFQPILTSPDNLIRGAQRRTRIDSPIASTEGALTARMSRWQRLL
jgi:hypothetical protein